MPTGTVTSVTSPNGLVTSSVYNSTFSKLIGVSAQNTSVNYTYDKNKLTSISFGYGSANTYNEKYNFEYDEFGNVLSTKVDVTFEEDTVWLSTAQMAEQRAYQEYICRWRTC